MQVPEKLSLIGGSILLASTLIFTLKGYASQIIPNVGHSVSNVYDHVGDAQYDSEFGNQFQDAQRKGEKTGHWGTAPYYIDSANNDMYVGKGQLQAGGTLRNTLGDGETDALHSLNIVGPVRAPQNSSNLFSVHY